MSKHGEISARAAGQNWMTILYVAAVFLYWLSLYLYVPTLPVYAKTKSADPQVMGLVLSMYGLWQAVVRLPLGVAADWLGRRKPFIVIGFVLTALGAWVMGAAVSIGGIGIGRAITGLAAATWVPLIVVFSALFPPEEAVRASTLLTLISTVARVIATMANGPLNDLSGGYQLAFYVAAGAAVVSVLLVLPVGDQVRPPKRPSVKDIGVLVVRRDVLLPSILSAVNQYAIWGTTFTFIPILADQLGATNVAKSLLASLNLGVGLVGNLLVATMTRRNGPRQLMSPQQLVQICLIVVCLGVGVAALAQDIGALFMAQFLIGLANGAIYPMLMGLSIQHVHDAERNTAMGLHQSVYAIGMFAGPWLSGILVKAIGIRPMFGATAVVCLAAGLLISRFLVVSKPTPDRMPDGAQSSG